MAWNFVLNWKTVWVPESIWSLNTLQMLFVYGKIVYYNTLVSRRGKAMIQATLCPCLYLMGKPRNFTKITPICE